jgi:hypothetical protein
MTYTFDSRLGEQLYQLLPQVYRTRDKTAGRPGSGSKTADLARYLDVHGQLLDMIHATLEQQLQDIQPESSQDWLLPYFAQLLAANIVSPDSAGRHAEITRAVSWRQRKGTLKCAEEIAEAVGQMEVEIREGWQRVAMTPRIGLPRMPAVAWDDTLDIDTAVPSQAARHPALPAVTVDLRRPSRAVEARPTNPAAKVSNFGGIRQTWRQANRHGAPCFPGSFDDVSRRTVDIRTRDAAKGQYHHKRLLAFTPPPTGLFPFEPIRLSWDERRDSRYEHLIEETEENGVRLVRNRTDRVIEITDEVVLDPAGVYRVEGLNFRTKLSVADNGRLELQGVEAVHVQVDTFGVDEPVLTAGDCLFNLLTVGAGTAKLDACTVLERATLKDVDAVNCIFNDFKYNPGVLITGLVRYSRIPATLTANFDDSPNTGAESSILHCTTRNPAWFGDRIAYNEQGQREKNGAGVLQPDCDPAIWAGASDGGEMGYFHSGRQKKPVRIDGDRSMVVPAAGGYPLADVIFEGVVAADGGRLELVRAAVRSLTVSHGLSFDGGGEVRPSLAAADCLFDSLIVGSGLARLEHCSVMALADCKHLQASDCIFVKAITGVAKPDAAKQTPSFFNCVRHSRIPAGMAPPVIRALGLMDERNEIAPGSNTMAAPVFIQFDYCNPEGFEKRAPGFGEPGCGVLDPVTPDAIRFGAEDGGEMGACHHKLYSLKAEAVLDKMREFLPVGIEPVLIPDPRLLHVPPEQIRSEESAGNGGGS